jgi:hypothetical protein
MQGQIMSYLLSGAVLMALLLGCDLAAACAPNCGWNCNARFPASAGHIPQPWFACMRHCDAIWQSCSNHTSSRSAPPASGRKTRVPSDVALTPKYTAARPSTSTLPPKSSGAPTHTRAAPNLESVHRLPSASPARLNPTPSPDTVRARGSMQPADAGATAVPETPGSPGPSNAQNPCANGAGSPGCILQAGPPPPPQVVLTTPPPKPPAAPLPGPPWWINMLGDLVESVEAQNFDAAKSPEDVIQQRLDQKNAEAGAQTGSQSNEVPQTDSQPDQQATGPTYTDAEGNPLDPNVSCSDDLKRCVPYGAKNPQPPPAKIGPDLSNFDPNVPAPPPWMDQQVWKAKQGWDTMKENTKQNINKQNINNWIFGQ